MKNTLNFLLFIFLLVIIFLSLNQYANDGQIENRWFLFEQEPKNSFDILFFGNSHNFTTVNPLIVDRLLGVNSFTLGTPNENIELTYAEIIHALEYQNPDAIVIETFVFDRDLDEPIYHFYRNIKIKMIDLIELFKLSHLDNLYKIFSFSNYHSLIWKSPDFLFNGYRQKNFIFNERYSEVYDKLKEKKGYLEKKNVIDIDDFQGLFFDYPNNIDNLGKFEYLNKIIEVCQKNDIKLIFYSAPLIDKNEDVNKNFYIEQITANNIPYIDLNTFEFNQIHFFDKGHLNNIGSIHATILLSEFFSKELNITMNEEEKYLFEKYDLVDHKIEINDKYVELILYTNENNNLNTYEWEYIQNENSKIITTNNSKIKIDDINLNDSFSIVLLLNDEEVNIPIKLFFNVK